MDHDDHGDHPAENGEGHVYQTETFVFTGNGGPAFLATMQNLMNRIMHGQEQHEQQPEQPEQPGQPGQPEQEEQTENQEHPQHPQTDTDMPAADDSPVPDFPLDNDVPPLEPLSNDGRPRPIRPLPRPHAHFHAHTANGIIDLFTFNIVGPQPPPPPPGTATFTFNVGPDFVAGFETFILGGLQKDREPDPERAKVLLKGMEVVPDGLVRRLNRAGGVPGGQGSEDSAGCAVCWGPLLDEVEPGEWDTAQEKADKAKMAAEGKEHNDHDDEGLHGRIVALPCAHVYHAECLLPWFSRNTTCPTCRFDIDPESLTWTARPPPSEPPPPPPMDDIMDDITLEDLNRTIPPPAGAPNLQAVRFNAFANSIFRRVPITHPQQPPPAPQNQPQVEPLQQQPQPQPQPQNPAEPQWFGAAPPHPPPPHSFVLPPFPGMHMPLFVVPPQAQPAVPGGNFANAPPPPPFQIPIPSPHAPHAHPAPHMQPIAIHAPPPPPFQIPVPPPHAPHVHPAPHMQPIAIHLTAEAMPNIPQGRSSQPPPAHHEPRGWTPPGPVGKTLRQRVEEKERELGLRCDDMVCGVAPSDEDPTPAALQSESGTKRSTIRAAYDVHGKACEHSFHPGCLVTSARVAGVTGDEDEIQNEDKEGTQGAEVQVACPVCRAGGSLTRAEWNDGVQASQAGTVY